MKNVLKHDEEYNAKKVKLINLKRKNNYLMLKYRLIE